MRRHNRSTDRPAIWAEGRQHPPFDARAFARAALLFGRESMAALLCRCAASAGDFGAELATGRWRIPQDRLGRTGRHLPDHRRIARAVTATGTLLGQSAAVLDPGTAIAAPGPIFDAPAPAACIPPAKPPAPEPLILSARTDAAPEDPSLAAIRSLIAADPAPRAVSSPAARATEPPGHSPLPPSPAPRARTSRAASVALGYGLLVMSLPWGAVRATLAHLNGEDLRNLDA
jgi:hypothetical protein